MDYEGELCIDIKTMGVIDLLDAACIASLGASCFDFHHDFLAACLPEPCPSDAKGTSMPAPWEMKTESTSLALGSHKIDIGP